MRRCVRLPPPDWLPERSAKWTAAWLQKAEKRRPFAWPQHKKRPLNLALLDAGLRDMTAGHCAYCDGWRLEPTGLETLDHFEPKSRAPHRAFEWANLFLACSRCQAEKRERWLDDLLRPDSADYEFDRYFAYDTLSGELRPNPGATDDDQSRARDAIELFGFNRSDRPAARRVALRRLADEPADERPYRFLFDT